MASKYTVYDTLRKRLNTDGFHTRGKYKQFGHPGKTATYLCDLYFKFNGVVSAHDLISYEIIREGQTIEFLSLLVRYKYLTWDMDENVKLGRHRYQTYASINLADLINKERGEEAATKKEVASLSHEVQALRDECSAHRQELIEMKEKFADHDRCLRKIINHYDPPVTEDKVKEYMNWSKEES